MSVERTSTAVEDLIAEHVAVSFTENDSPVRAKSTATQIRSRITDHFQPGPISSDQDNSPPAILALYNRLFSAFSLVQPATISHDRTAQLDLLHKRLEELCREAADSMQGHATSARVDLLLERQELALKNEFTVGFGQVEMGLVSTAALALVLLNAIDLLWAVPILALGIGRSWHLDRQCRKRRARIAEIDAFLVPAA